MGRLHRTAGGDSQLSYLFGNSSTKPNATPPTLPPSRCDGEIERPPAGTTSEMQRPNVEVAKPAVALVEANMNIRTSMDNVGESSKEEAAALARRKGHLGRSQNNYERYGGQNNDNFITDRPSTRVHSKPGGNSQLGYLFGGN